MRVFKNIFIYLFKYGLQISNKLSPTYPIKDLKLNSIYKYIYISWSGVFIVVTFLLSHISDPIILLFFFFLLSFFFPLSLPQIQLGLSVFFFSLFSINCAFSMSFLVLMFALKFLLLNKSDWKCRTIENSLLW